MTREQRLVLFQLLPPQAQYVEVLSRNGDSMLLAWRRKPWGITQGMVRIQVAGPLASLDRGEHGTRLENRENFPEKITVEEVTL